MAANNSPAISTFHAPLPEDFSPKYILAPDCKKVIKPTLDIECVVYRIVAAKDFGGVKKGTLGGYVESLNNLSQKGNCWIGGNAIVTGNARVAEGAYVLGNAVVTGKAQIYGNAIVCEESIVFGECRICGNARVTGGSYLCEDTAVYGNAVVNDVNISGRSRIFDNAVLNNASGEDVFVYKNAKLENRGGLTGQYSDDPEEDLAF